MYVLGSSMNILQNGFQNEIEVLVPPLTLTGSEEGEEGSPDPEGRAGTDPEGAYGADPEGSDLDGWSDPGGARGLLCIVLEELDASAAAKEAEGKGGCEPECG